MKYKIEELSLLLKLDMKVESSEEMDIRMIIKMIELHMDKIKDYLYNRQKICHCDDFPNIIKRHLERSNLWISRFVKQMRNPNLQHHHHYGTAEHVLINFIF